MEPARPAGTWRRLARRVANPVRALVASRDPIDAYALVQMTSSAGDALVAIALADSIFFSLPVGQARVRVALYLALAMAPLAFAAPLLVPLLDRSGTRRAVSASAGAGRALAATFAAAHTAGLLLFPAVFVVLVLSRVHGVTRNGLVAAYRYRAEDLVAANGRLGWLAATAVAIVSGPGALALLVGGAPVVLYVAAIAYATSTVLNLRLPRPSVAPAPPPPEPDERSLRRGRLPALHTAAVGTGALRAAQGFLVFLLAFSLRAAGRPTIWFGILGLAMVIGAFAGDLLAPRLPPSVRAETVVLGSLLLGGIAALLTVLAFGLASLAVFTLLAGAATEVGRLAFQSLMQRTAPGGRTGRVYVRYEVAFQLAWVAGAFFPAMIPIPFRGGVATLAAFYVVAAAAFLVRAGRAPAA